MSNKVYGEYPIKKMKKIIAIHVILIICTTSEGKEKKRKEKKRKEKIYSNRHGNVHSRK
jgi:hypothetical protein